MKLYTANSLNITSNGCCIMNLLRYMLIYILRIYYVRCWILNDEFAVSDKRLTSISIGVKKINIFISNFIVIVYSIYYFISSWYQYD